MDSLTILAGSGELTFLWTEPLGWRCLHFGLPANLTIRICRHVKKLVLLRGLLGCASSRDAEHLAEEVVMQLTEELLPLASDGATNGK